MQNCESFKNAFSGVGILGGQIRLCQFQLSGLSLHFLVSEIGLMIVPACNGKKKIHVNVLAPCSASVLATVVIVSFWSFIQQIFTVDFVSDAVPGTEGTGVKSVILLNGW